MVGGEPLLTMSTLDVTVRERLTHRRLVDGAFVVLCYIVVSALEGVLVSAFDLPVLGWIDLVAVLPIALVLAFGPVAVWTVPVGSLAASFVGSAGGLFAVVLAVAHAYMAYAASVIFGRAAVTPGETTRASWWRALGPYLLGVTVATAGAGAIVAWGGEMTQTAPFFVTVVSTSVGYLVVNLPCALPLAVVFRRTLADEAESIDLTARLQSEPREPGRVRRVVAVTGAWILVGALGSVGYRTFVALPTDAFTRRGLDVVLALEQPALFGPGAGRLQVLLGAVMFVGLLVALQAGEPETSEPEVNEQ